MQEKNKYRDAIIGESDLMVNSICQNVIDCLVKHGIDRSFAENFVKKGVKDMGETMDTIEEKKMGLVLQQHIYPAIKMFVDESKAKKIIHEVTFTM